MLLDFAFWAVICLISVWVLLVPISRLVAVVWQILIPIIDAKPVDLKKKFGEWAVVTGSTDGIGKAYAKELASRGLNLVLISRNMHKLENTREEILNTCPAIAVKLLQIDFAKGRQVYKTIDEFLKDIPVGILVNNVGKNYEYPMYLEELPEDEMWDVINVNVGAVTQMTRVVLNQMRLRARGAIVNLSSGSEFQPLPMMTVYAATKVYIKSFSEGIRAEYAQHGITVQHLTPFFINTKMNAFSDRLQVTSVFVPDATTYAKNAIETLGKLNTSTGYWAHGIQGFFTLIPPMWIRTKIGYIMNKALRKEYDKKLL